MSYNIESSSDESEELFYCLPLPAVALAKAAGGIKNASTDHFHLIIAVAKKFLTTAHRSFSRWARKPVYHASDNKAHSQHSGRSFNRRDFGAHLPNLYIRTGISGH